MKKNIGNADKLIRVVIALAIGGLGLYFNSWWGLLGIVPLLTAFISFCPLYSFFGLNTVRKNVQ